MAGPRTTALRRALPVLVSGGLVLLMGVVGLVATRTASMRALEVHREDRQRLEVALGDLTGQATAMEFQALRGLLATQESSGAARFSAVPAGPGQARDVDRLRATLDTAVTLDVGAAVLDGAGLVVASWFDGPAVSPADPGFAPLAETVQRRAGDRVPLSGVVQHGEEPVGAMGAPVTLDDGSAGLFVGFWRLRSNKLQEFNTGGSKLAGGWVVDPRGLAMAAPTDAQVGRPFPYAEALAAVAGGGGEGQVSTDEQGGEWVSHWRRVPGTPWVAVSVESKEAFQGELDRSRRTAQAAVVALLLMAGTLLVLLHVRREAALREIAKTDELTSIANRRGWFLAAQAELEQAARDRQERVLLFVDLDGLKQVNDVLGHAEGDQAIAAAASVLVHSTAAGDVLGRIGGDEFVVLLGAGVDAATARARLTDALRRYNARSGAGFELRLSLGSETWAPGDPCSLDELVRRADARMYADKQSRPLRGEGLLRVPSRVSAPA